MITGYFTSGLTTSPHTKNLSKISWLRRGLNRFNKKAYLRQRILPPPPSLLTSPPIMLNLPLGRKELDTSPISFQAKHFLLDSCLNMHCIIIKIRNVSSSHIILKIYFLFNSACPFHPLFQPN